MRTMPGSALLAATLTMLLVSAPREASAQTVSQTANGAINSSTPSSKASETQAIAKQTPQCVHILNECKKLGFIAGQYQKDNGLWKDCFDPIVYGKGHPTREGSPITVPVNQSDVHACHAAVVGKT